MDWCGRSYADVFEIKEDEYWTQPHDFAAMRYTNPHLYSELAKSDLLIFKGKNYSIFIALNPIAALGFKTGARQTNW